jgi:chromosome segregation ATPase
MKLTLTFALALCCAAGAVAQTAPATKPAAKPAATTTKPADGKTLAIGGGAGTATKAGSPILTRNELRACLNQEESLRVRLEAQDKGRVPLDDEKTAISTDQAALRADRAAVDDVMKKGEEFKTRQSAYVAKVNDWNTRVQAHNEDKGARNNAYEQNSQRLTREKAELEKERTELVAEGERWNATMRPVVDAYNTKAKALDARVTAWNERNAKWNDTTRALESERQAWVGTCADRRYREDDEKAIRAGK